MTDTGYSMTARVELTVPQRVFVIEDDALLREAVDLILTHAGYLVTTTAVGRGAVGLASQFRPHLVLLDIRLPDISGLKVLEMLRRAGHAMPIVMMTADNQPATLRDVMALGGTGYLLKPFEPEDLVGRVAAALRSVVRAPRYLDD